MKPISVQLYSVREEAAKDFPGVLQKIADIGYKGVELAGLHGMSPAELRKVIDDLGLQVSSAHMEMPNAANAARLVDECHTLGITKLISGFGPDNLSTVEGCLAAAETAKQAVAALQGTGIAFGIHNHWWEFQRVDGQYPEDLILRNAPGCFAQIDVYWCAVAGADPAGEVARLKDRVPLLHIKDGFLEPKEPHTAVGKGVLDIKSIIGAADPNILEWVIVELDSCATDMMEAVAESYRYLTENGLAVGNK